MDKGGLTVKALFSVSVLALALVLGSSAAMLTASTTGAKAQAKAKAPAAPVARMALCNGKLKGMYTGDGRITAYGFCLQGIMPDRWQ
jgi:hypothetical protein